MKRNEERMDSTATEKCHIITISSIFVFCVYNMSIGFLISSITLKLREGAR